VSVADWGDKFLSAAYRDPNAPQFAATGVEGTILGMRVYVTPLHVGDGFAVHDVMGAAVLNAYGVLKIVND